MGDVFQKILGWMLGVLASVATFFGLYQYVIRRRREEELSELKEKAYEDDRQQLDKDVTHLDDSDKLALANKRFRSYRKRR
jgi:HAMP domain-containing protein